MCGSDAPPSTTTSKFQDADPSKIDRILLRLLVDVHCHPTDSRSYNLSTLNINDISMKQICVMSSTIENQVATRDLKNAYPDRIIPCYGLHPWFTHHISLLTPAPSKEEHYASLFPTSSTDSSLHPSLVPSLDLLPNVTCLSTFLIELENNLLSSPDAFLGEVGLDAAFRIPLLAGGKNDPTVAPINEGEESRRSNLSPLFTPLNHQIAIAKAQIDLAIKLRKKVSFHSVRSSKETLDLLASYKLSSQGLGGNGFEKIHFCLHSFGGSAESARDVQRDHSNVFFSFATAISGRSPKFFEMLRMIKSDRILLESDYCNLKKLDAQMMEIFEAVCEAKEWTREQCLEQIENNWERFLSEPVVIPPKKSRKERRLESKH